MRIKRVVMNGKAAAIVEDEMPLITDAMVAMEIVMRARFELGVSLLAIEASALAPEFFDPESGMAGAVLEQFAQYGVKGAVFGEVGFYGEEALSELRKSVHIAEDPEAAIAWLSENQG